MGRIVRLIALWAARIALFPFVLLLGIGASLYAVGKAVYRAWAESRGPAPAGPSQDELDLQGLDPEDMAELQRDLLEALKPYQPPPTTEPLCRAQDMALQALSDIGFKPATPWVRKYRQGG